MFFFPIEPIRINNELSAQAQYLYLQLDYLIKINCQKNHFLYLKLILLLSGDISLNPGPIRNNQVLKETEKSLKEEAYILYISI